VFKVSIDVIRRTCIATLDPNDKKLWFIILIVGFAVIQAILIMRYWVRAMNKFKKLQKRFRRKVEKKKLLKIDIHSTKKEQLPDPDDSDVSVYGKFEKKNTKYLEKLQKID